MQQLIADLKSKAFKKAYLLYGAEDYLVHFYAERISSVNVCEEDRFMNLVRLRREEATVERVAESIVTLPFLGDKRVTWVKDSGWFSLKKGKTDDKSKSDSEEDDAEDTPLPANLADLETALNSMPDSSIVIFEEKKADKRSALYKRIGKIGYCAELKTPDTDGLIRFVKKEAAALQKNVDDRTAQYLAEYVGGDLYYMQQQIQKICAYAGERSALTVSDVQAIATHQIDAAVFDLTDAIGAKDTKRARQLLMELFNQNMVPQRIMVAMANQFRRLYRTKLAMEAQMTKEETETFLGSKAYFSYSRQQRVFSKERLAKLIDLCVELDDLQKRSMISPEDAMTKLILIAK